MMKNGDPFNSGGDRKVIEAIANSFYGGHRSMFEAHGWEWPGQRTVSVVSTKIFERYGSIKAFERYHLNQPVPDSKTAHDLLNAYEGAWMKGFWGWSPETWGCVGYPNEGLRTRFFRNDLNTRLMFIYVTQSAGKKDDAPEALINRIVGFYELSEVEGLRYDFQEAFHHEREPGKWLHSIKAHRAFTIRNKPLPYTYDADLIFKTGGMGTRYGINSDALSSAAYEFLKSCTYEEVPVFGSSMMGANGISFPPPKQTNLTSSETKQPKKLRKNPVRGGAPNNSGYYVKPETDSEKSLYILELRGDIDSYTNKNCSGKKIIKVGLSYSPESRKEFFNLVIPDGQYGWEILRSTQLDGHAPYSCHRVAERGEWAMKEFFHSNPENHLSGEFYLTSESEIQKAWSIGRRYAVEEERKATKNANCSY